MKATKAAIIRQAQLAKKDIASGRVSSHAEQAVDTLADYSNAAVELLDYHVTQAVDGTKGIHGMIPKSIFTAQ